MGDTQQQEVTNMRVNEAIVDHAPRFPHRDDPVIAEDAELVRDGRLIPTKPGRKIADAQLSCRRLQESRENLEPCGIPKQCKQVRDLRSLLNRQPMFFDRFDMLWMNTASLADILLESRTQGVVGTRMRHYSSSFVCTSV
jgi:hypothetical protein